MTSLFPQQPLPKSAKSVVNDQKQHYLRTCSRILGRDDRTLSAGEGRPPVLSVRPRWGEGPPTASPWSGIGPRTARIAGSATRLPRVAAAHVAHDAHDEREDVS